MEKKATNICPICGGTVSIAAYARVWLGVNVDGSVDLDTDAKGIICDAVRTINKKDGIQVEKQENGNFDISYGKSALELPYEAICDECEAELKAKRLPNGNFEFSADV